MVISVYKNIKTQILLSQTKLKVRENYSLLTVIVKYLYKYLTGLFMRHSSKKKTVLHQQKMHRCWRFVSSDPLSRCAPHSLLQTALIYT